MAMSTLGRRGQTRCLPQSSLLENSKFSSRLLCLFSMFKTTTEGQMDDRAHGRFGSSGTLQVHNGATAALNDVEVGGQITMNDAEVDKTALGISGSSVALGSRV